MSFSENTSRIQQAVYDLTQQQGPLCAYLYDLAGLREHVESIVASLPERCRLFYAMKANSEQPILKTLAPLVHGFEVASTGEMQKARAIAPAVPLIFGGPGKTDEELEEALLQGVSLIHIESLHELRRLEWLAARHGRISSVLLRVNMRRALSGATLYMTGRPTQFGIDEVDIPEAIQLCRQAQHIRLEGFHFHAVSNNLDAEQHIQLVRDACWHTRNWAAAYDLTITTLNVGGGIGINYTDPQRQFDWPTFVAQLQHLCAEEIPAQWTVVFECGRYLTAACGTYAVEVLDIKQNHGKNFLVVAGGSHHLRLPAAWRHSHPFIILPLNEWHYPFPRPNLFDCEVTIAGQLCTPRDILAHDVLVPSVRIGDILLFQYTGAYGWTISHHDFLSHPHPTFVYLE